MIVMTIKNLTKMSKILAFGEVRKLADDVAESRIIPVMISDGGRDRHHTKLNMENWQLDNYRKNPVVGYMHNLYGDMCNGPDPDQIIGKDISLAVNIEEGVKGLFGRAELESADVNPLAEKIFRKILFGSLRSVSVGFLEIGHGQWGKDSEAEGADNETYFFSGQELLEYSFVNIPSNPDAGKRHLMRMQSLRDNASAALTYAYRELGGELRFSQIEQLRVKDVLDLLEGKDLEIRSTDPDEVRLMIASINKRNGGSENNEEAEAKALQLAKDRAERQRFMRIKELGLLG